MHIVDWSQAYQHRLAHLSCSALVPEQVTHGMAERLATELLGDTLPFLSLSFQDELEKQMDAVLQGVTGCTDMLLLGIGGSALGARALQKAFYPQQDWPGHSGKNLWIADNIDAHALEAWLQRLDPARTVVVVVSKSGGTIETMAQYILVRQWLTARLGAVWHEHVIIVTDAHKGALRAEAQALGIASLPVPDNLGGRYSVFSAVGMLPAAFMGIDWQGLLAGARAVSTPLMENPLLLAQHPAWHLAVWNYALMEQSYDQLIFFCYIPSWQSLGDWFAQLWAESLGKEGKGSLPVPAIGVTDQHATNQMFLDGARNKGCLFLSCPYLDAGQSFPHDLPKDWTYLAGRQFGDLLQAEGLGTRMALASSGVPLVHIELGSANEEAAGRFMQTLMLTTVLTGWLLQINPIDQPAVELGKRLANARLGAPGYEHEKQELAAFLTAQAEGQHRDRL